MITLTTDFGTRDWFVGTMKAVILGLYPRANVVDITHEICGRRFNIAAPLRFSRRQAGCRFAQGSVGWKTPRRKGCLAFSGTTV